MPQATNFSTADNKLDGLSNNSGWWSGGSSVADTTTNDIFFAGTHNGVDYRNFFSFNLGLLDLTGMMVSSAKLVAPLGQVVGQGLTYNLFDVSTNVVDLNDNYNKINASIFNDLGSGTSYGSFAVPASTPFEMNLNADALAAISNKGWFSLGGSLSTINVSGDYYLFGTTIRTPVILQVETVAAPVPPTAPVAAPEPATLLGFGVPMLMVGLGKIRSLRK